MSSQYVIRSATPRDLFAINTICYDDEYKWFGDMRTKFNGVKTLFATYQTHRLVVHDANDDDRLLGYAEFRNYPNLVALSTDSWMEWLTTRYCITDDITWMNCLFFTFCIYEETCPEIIAEVARELFYIENGVRFLIAIKVPAWERNRVYVESYDDLEKYAESYYPFEFDLSNANTQSLFIIKRLSLLPTLTFRKAFTQDNDNVVEMHSQDYPEVRAQHGDFYVAEELLRTDEDAQNNLLIVAEVENGLDEPQITGFLWLESEVDIYFLVRNYSLEMFGNLLKFNPSNPYKSQVEYVYSVECTPEANLFSADALEDIEENTILGGLQKHSSIDSVASCSKIQFSSKIGAISDTTINLKQKLYLRRALYTKFIFVIEKINRSIHYIKQTIQEIQLNYNTDKLEKGEDGIRKASNVFGLRYICMHQELPVENLFTLLGAMFCAFPDRDYCIMSIPKSTVTLRSTNEALKYFMPVAERPSEVSNLEDLYITHRSRIFGELSVYPLEDEDVQTIESLTMGASSSSYWVIEKIIEDVLENEDSEFDVFTIRCGNSSRPAKENTTIGYVILRRFLHHAQLHDQYHLPRNDHLRTERAEIISLKIHPLFNTASDIILRTLAAKTKYYDYYFIEPLENHLFSNDLKTRMMLLEPKQLKKYFYKPPEPQSEHKYPIEGLPTYDFRTDHLVIFRHKLKPSRWFGNTNRLVIIGFTPLTRAILRQLVFMWNSMDHENSEIYTCLTRLQVTVIAAPGKVEAEYDKIFKCHYCKNRRRCYMSHDNSSSYVRDTARRMDLRYWVHFIGGDVSGINRQKKFVMIDDSCEIIYDNLILSNCLRYCLESCGKPELGQPCNFIEINNRHDKFKLYYKLRLLLHENQSNYNIILHGFNLETYECMSYLLSHGVSAKKVVLIIPSSPIRSELEQKYTSPWVDTNVQYIVNDMLKDLGVTIHHDLNFKRWVQHGEWGFITEVFFSDRMDKEVRFDCDLFISFIEGYMDDPTWRWLTQSGIQMGCNNNSSSILVNQKFCTNDPNIYAVGNYIKITDYINYQQKNTSAKETAAKLLHHMGLRPYDKTFEYRYSKPTYYQGLLPLDYYVTKLTMPRRYLASYVLPCIWCPLTTYHDKTFCRLVMSPKNIVEEIVVVTKNNDYFDYLESFCGKHEAMLNNLLARFKDGFIPCLLKFLQEPWAELVMHECFDDFQAQNHKLLRPMLVGTDQNKEVTTEEFTEVNTHILERNLMSFMRLHQREFYHNYALPEDFCPDVRSTLTMQKIRDTKTNIS